MREALETPLPTGRAVAWLRPPRVLTSALWPLPSPGVTAATEEEGVARYPLHLPWGPAGETPPQRFHSRMAHSHDR